MRLAALLLGIFAGIDGFGPAILGHQAVWLLGLVGLPDSQQAAAKSLLWGLPIASLIGGGCAFSGGGLSTILLLGSAVGWYLIGDHFGAGFNIFTAPPLILSGIGGVFALGAMLAGSGNRDSQSQYSSSAGEILISKSEGNRNAWGEIEAHPVNLSRTHYDAKKWQALVTYDEELAKIARLFAPLGQQWSDRLAADYLAIGDKAYLPEIARKIMADARAERDREEAENKRREEETLRIQTEHRIRYEATQKARPRRIAAGFAVVCGISLTGGILWYFEVFQRFGLVSPSASVVRASAPPSAPQSKIATLVDKRDPARQAVTPEGLNSNAALGLAKGKATDNSATWGALFQSQVERCWKKPYGGIEAQNPEAAFAIRLKRDGTLEAMPVLEGTPATPYLRVYQDSALRAIIECQPYKLPAEYFDEWKYFAPVFTEHK